MLHRLTLRVLPNLAIAVTGTEVRKRKRLVMLVPGLVAFGVYRMASASSPLSDAPTLLVLSGLLCAITALCAYQISRQVPWTSLWVEDGPRRLAWVAVWIGFVYGVQLALLVLMLCLIVNYDFRLHPSGPAMMALIIASTSVARDAFEIGHVRRLQHGGQPVLTFPDGTALRGALGDQPEGLLRWAAAGLLFCAAGAGVVATLGEAGRSLPAQLAIVTLLSGTVALVSYLAGQQPDWWWSSFKDAGSVELLRFWAWPGLAFGASYYLVLVGAMTFVGQAGALSAVPLAVMAGGVGGLLGLYCYYLGWRRRLEDKVLQSVPSSLLRCPFVMGLLSKGKSGGGVEQDKATLPSSLSS